MSSRDGHVEVRYYFEFRTSSSECRLYRVGKLTRVLESLLKHEPTHRVMPSSSAKCCTAHLPQSSVARSNNELLLGLPNNMARIPHSSRHHVSIGYLNMGLQVLQQNQDLDLGRIPRWRGEQPGQDAIPPVGGCPRSQRCWP